jgi:hypothetical protein
MSRRGNRSPIFSLGYLLGIVLMVVVIVLLVRLIIG